MGAMEHWGNNLRPMEDITDGEYENTLIKIRVMTLTEEIKGRDYEDKQLCYGRKIREGCRKPIIFIILRGVIKSYKFYNH